jgi:hypothetical protein
VARRAARLLPAGTLASARHMPPRSKPEHNGHFDARSERYCRALDDGRDLPLKAGCVMECVARACAAAGCASATQAGSEEAHDALDPRVCCVLSL